MQIKLKEVSIENDGAKLVGNINFTFGEGFYIIEGINGSGKSSLLDILFKVKKNYIGDIYIDNNRLKRISNRAIRDKMSYIRQEVFLLECLCPKENINLLLSSEEIKVAKKLYHNILEYPFDKKISDMSGGQKKILNIIIGISKNSGIYLIDEPFNNISSNNLKHMIDLIKSLKGIVIIVDHTTILKNELSCEIIKISDGELKHE